MSIIRQYLYDESIKADPVAYSKLYEEVKVEAALVSIVRTLSVALCIL